MIVQPRVSTIDRHQTRQVGSTDLCIDALCMGLSPLGNLYRAHTDDDAHAALQAWWDKGLRTFDVAPVYGFGTAERRLGAFLAGKPRADYVVCTKVGRLLRRGAPVAAEFLMPDGTPQWLATPDGVQPVYDYSADGVRRSLEESLERLGLDHVDCVHIHDPDLQLPEAIAHAFPALSRLRAEGLIRAVGVGTNSDRVALTMARACDLDCLLVAGRCTLLNADAESELLPLAAERGISLFAAGVFHGGFLADPRPGAMFDYRPSWDPALLERVKAMRAVCESHGVALKAAAIQYPARHPEVSAVIVGPASRDEARDCVDLFNVALPDSLWAELEHLRDRLVQLHEPRT